MITKVILHDTKMKFIIKMSWVIGMSVLLMISMEENTGYPQVSYYEFLDVESQKVSFSKHSKVGTRKFDLQNRTPVRPMSTSLQIFIVNVLVHPIWRDLQSAGSL